MEDDSEFDDNSLIEDFNSKIIMSDDLVNVIQLSESLKGMVNQMKQIVMYQEHLRRQLNSSQGQVSFEIIPRIFDLNYDLFFEKYPRLLADLSNSYKHYKMKVFEDILIEHKEYLSKPNKTPFNSEEEN